ncbi:uncharacterized protein LOC111338692 [Stylophora pistillata]|uniref:uncharacterized protein LOC111338692 n=1 Tax=Stylophora pistillata TaxID=50429 RepID=UPI000C04F91B|nr:uncharacterized protein LOC111338692 [Stylophora pistillata]
MRLTTVLLVSIVLMAMVELSETRGRGGGGRSGGSRGSRSSRSSRSRSRSRGSSSKPKITKYTPIKATSVRSPVIVKQTKLGSRSSTFKRAVAAYLVTRYAFSSAPVYRQGYPMYRSYVSIPKKRAVRVTLEKERLLDDSGNLCLNELAGSQTTKEGIDDNLVDLKTTVKYKNGETKTLHGVDKTLSLEDIKDQDFEVVTLASYNITIVTATTCTQVEKTVEGTMVTLYETNPNGSSRLNIDNNLLSVVITLFMSMNLHVLCH